jgi:hypothetical protein
MLEPPRAKHGLAMFGQTQARRGPARKRSKADCLPHAPESMGYSGVHIMGYGRTCLAVAAVFGSGLFAQDFRATVTGQVTDQSGAAIPGAKVRAVQRSTNQAIERETNHEGYFKRQQRR